MAKFYFCENCKKIVELVDGSGDAAPICCSQLMRALEPNTVDAAKEKHVPVVSFEKGAILVNVGAIAHPMTEEHLIKWIQLETSKGAYRHYLKANDVPMARFFITEDEDPLQVYAYCNLHGLWSASV